MIPIENLTDIAHRAVNTLRRLPARPLVLSQQSSHLTTHPQCIFITYTSYATASDEHYRACRYTDGSLVLARERVMDAEIWSCSGLSDMHTNCR